jgi:hypothetical protein
MEINLVVRRVHLSKEGRSSFEYLTGEDDWSSVPSDAWLYGSITAFTHAEDFGGDAFLRLPQGREIAVELTDFWTPAEPG